MKNFLKNRQQEVQHFKNGGKRRFLDILLFSQVTIPHNVEHIGHDPSLSRRTSYWVMHCDRGEGESRKSRSCGPHCNRKTKMHVPESDFEILAKSLIRPSRFVRNPIHIIHICYPAKSIFHSQWSHQKSNPRSPCP